MFAQLTSYWRYGSSFCGIEITDDTAGTTQLATVTAKKQQGEFKDLTFFKTTSFEDLVTSIGKNKHAFLLINTNDVLLKEVPFEKDTIKAVSAAFPGLSISDFYYEVLPTQQKSFVAICRKEAVEQLLEKAQQAGIAVVGFRLGFASLSMLIPFLKGDTIAASGFQFEVSENEITAFSNSPGTTENYLIGNETISSDHLLATSGLFGYLGNYEIPSNTVQKNAALATSHTEKNFFKKGLAVGIGLLLLALVINMLFYTGYRKEYQQLQGEAELAATQKIALDNTIKEVETKERVVENILNSGNSKSSYFINRITTTKPQTVIFNQVVFQPMQKTIRPDKPIEYNPNQLLLLGESTDKENFSQWIEQLEQLNWIEQVTVLNYGAIASAKDGYELSLLLKDDTKK